MGAAGGLDRMTVRHYARLAELLLLWRHGAPDHREVVYLAHHIAAERQLWVGHEDGGVR